MKITINSIEFTATRQTRDDGLIVYNLFKDCAGAGWLFKWNDSYLHYSNGQRIELPANAVTIKT
jgi:hypothetical protein